MLFPTIECLMFSLVDMPMCQISFIYLCIKHIFQPSTIKLISTFELFHLKAVDALQILSQGINSNIFFDNLLIYRIVKQRTMLRAVVPSKSPFWIGRFVRMFSAAAATGAQSVDAGSAATSSVKISKEVCIF